EPALAAPRGPGGTCLRAQLGVPGAGACPGGAVGGLARGVRRRPRARVHALARAAVVRGRLLRRSRGSARAPPLFDLGEACLTRSEVGSLVGELVPRRDALRRDLPDLDRAPDLAARLRHVQAVAVAAALGETRQILERVVDLRGAPRLELAHPGRVDEEAAARNDEHL